MANSKGPSSYRNMMYNGKNTLLPPKSPFPSLSPSSLEYIPVSAIGPKALPRPRDGNSHQRTSSESFLIEEQPSWLDDLLNEPETPVRRGGHRRASSDSFAYMDVANGGGMNFAAQDDNKFRNMVPLSSWGNQDFDVHRDIHHNNFYADLNPIGRTKSKPWDAPVSTMVPPRGLPSRDSTIIPNVGLVSSLQDVDRNPTSFAQKPDAESGSHDPKGFSEKKDLSHVKSSTSETDTKRAKQQYAQRSRVRKLQYIAELEKHVQDLQAEGCEVSAELEFLNQQNLILSMENKALKQRLESLSQEKLVKYFEQEVLEREVGRLQSLYQQQQQQQQQLSSSHRRSKSRDLDQQFANLSLSQQGPSDSVPSQLHM